MIENAATGAQPKSASPYRPSYLDEVDPADERHDGAREVEGDLSFDDLIDMLNPLQHLPIVSTVYRAITGDQIQPHVRAIGAGIYGGPVGFLAAGAAMAVEEAVGSTADATLADLFEPEADEADALARAPTEPPVTRQATAQAAGADNTAAVLPPPNASQAAAEASTVSLPAPNAAQATQMFAIKDRPKLFALPSAANQTMPLPQRPAAAPLNQAQAVEAAVARTSTAQSPSEVGNQGLSASQGDLLDQFIAGANQQTSARSPMLPGISQPTQMPPAGASPEWFAAQMQANLQKYADAQRGNASGS